jgi:hypothetical protein
MADVRISDNHKRSFTRELTAGVMLSLGVNSDTFEIYVMRNIFRIPVRVDLAGSLVRSPASVADELDRSFERDGDPDDLDDEIQAPTAEIDRENERWRQRVRFFRSLGRPHSLLRGIFSAHRIRISSGMPQHD